MPLESNDRLDLPIAPGTQLQTHTASEGMGEPQGKVKVTVRPKLSLPWN